MPAARTLRDFKGPSKFTEVRAPRFRPFSTRPSPQLRGGGAARLGAKICESESVDHRRGHGGTRKRGVQVSPKIVHDTDRGALGIVIGNPGRAQQDKETSSR